MKNTHARQEVRHIARRVERDAFFEETMENFVRQVHLVRVRDLVVFIVCLDRAAERKNVGRRVNVGALSEREFQREANLGTL